MIRRPPRSTLDRSSAASDVYKRQVVGKLGAGFADDRIVADNDPFVARMEEREVQHVVGLHAVPLRQEYCGALEQVVDQDP